MQACRTRQLWRKEGRRETRERKGRIKDCSLREGAGTTVSRGSPVGLGIGEEIRRQLRCRQEGVEAEGNLQNQKYPMTMTIWQINPAQKGPDAMGEPLMPSLNVQYDASGKTEPGPILLGAVFRATMTATEPMTSSEKKPSSVSCCDGRGASGNETHSEPRPAWRRHGGATTSARESYLDRYPGWRPELRAKARDRFRGMVRRVQPKGCRGRDWTFPRASDTISGNRDRLRRRRGSTSASLRAW